MGIATDITRLKGAKADLKTAINTKGGTLTTETIDDYAAAVDAIAIGVDVSGVTAAAGDVLATKIIVNADGDEVEGTMTNVGAQSITPTAAGVAITAGYHNGSGGTVADADLVAGNIKHNVNIFNVTGTYDTEASNPIAAGTVLLNKIGFVNGSKITGSMPNRGAVSGEITTKAGAYTVQDGYHNGSGTVAISAAEQAKIIGGNIKSGVTLLGQAGGLVDYSADYINFVEGDAVSLTLPNATKVKGYAFVDMTNLTTVTLTSTVTEIGNWAFSDCSAFITLNFSTGLTTLGNYVFGYCTSLLNMALPNSVITLGYNVFGYCTSLQKVWIPSSVTSVGESIFYDCPSTCKVYCEAGSKPAGWDATWNYYNNDTALSATYWGSNISAYNAA